MNYYYYLDVLLKIESKDTRIVDIYTLKQIITKGVKELFGEAGASNQVDIIKYEEREGRAILRCFSNFYVKLRASLSFCSHFNNILYSFHVGKASTSLISLQANSRTFQF